MKDNSNNNEMIPVNVSWHNATKDCVGYDVYMAKSSSIQRRVRLFLKVKYGEFNGRELKFPRWYLNGALRRATEMLDGKWYIADTGEYQF